MNKKLFNIAILSLFLSLFLAAQTHAAPLRSPKGDTPDNSLYRKAKFIIKGKVKQIRNKRSFNGDMTFTRTTIAVSEELKGKAGGKTIIVEIQEKEADEEAESGDPSLADKRPQFEKGEDVLLFLTRSFWRKNVYYLADSHSGKYSICPDDSLQREPCFETLAEEEDINEEEVQNEEKHAEDDNSSTQSEAENN
ncbi:hypothetical protein C4572_02640 [Candidatus Parcubacteria bacterium]|nr:MAG: hypothetical protein C4572_02640 [Candidatus Parcubacteria bacterium]